MKKEKFVKRAYNIHYAPNYQLPIQFFIYLIYPIGTIKRDIWEIALQSFDKPFIKLDEVDSWFNNEFFELTGQELQNFVMQLNILRVTKPMGQHKEQTPATQAIELFRKLHDLLPDTMEFANKKSIDLSDKKDKSDIFTSFSNHCNNIKANIDALKEDGLLIETPTHIKQHKNSYWHLDAVFVAQQIYDMAENRGINLSFKQVDSKLIQITQLALERAGIISVERAAIVKALNRFLSKDEYKKRSKYAPNN